MKTILWLLLLQLLFPYYNSLETKRILMVIFPGGRSHNFVISKLFKHTIAHQTKFKYEYHIIVHNIDKDTWNDVNQSDSFHMYGYGNKTLYKDYLGKGIEMMNNNPTLGFFNFNKGMKFNIKEFLDSHIIDQLRKIHFDMIGADVASFIHVFLQKELQIDMKFYLSPPSLPQLSYPNFELNPSYMPTIGSVYSDVMSFKERCLNYFFQNASKLIFYFFQREQAKKFKDYGYELLPFIHFQDAMHFIQYPLGIAFPFSAPPNFVFLSPITLNESKPIRMTNQDIDVFLNKSKKNIYLSQGTIMNIIQVKDQIDMFRHFESKEIGFVLSIREDSLLKEEIMQMPSNVLVVRWINQNDLLGDNRIHGFITHGGINSVSESIYHNKPMIVLGVGLDQLNTAAFTKKLNVGVVIQDRRMITSENLIEAITDLLSNDVYASNVERVNKIIRDLKNPMEQFQYWFDFGLAHTFKPLIIDLYVSGNWWQIYGFDVFIVYLLIFVLFVVISASVIKRLLHCCCLNKSKEKKD